MIKIEKTQKMYLLPALWPSIFVPELQTTSTLRNIISILIIILCQTVSSYGQEVWPGDVNNNGIVNNVDILYWGVAQGEEGAPRIGPTVDWIGQLLPLTLWEGSFQNGLNFAYADCNGDGVVDDKDKTVIENNFGQNRLDSVPDVFPDGDPLEDPTLLLSSDKAEFGFGETLNAPLSLGNMENQVSDLFGIAFTLKYDPDYVATQGNSVQIDIPDDSWISGKGNEKAHISIDRKRRKDGFIDVTIVQKKGEPASGFGEIGTANIVMEDIVVGKSQVEIIDVMAIDNQAGDIPIATSILRFELDSVATVTPAIQPIRRDGINLYPNPAQDEITVELQDAQESIQRIQLFDLSGRRLMDWDTDLSNKKRIQLGGYSDGLYALKIFSDRHVYIRRFVRKR
jgi:hypothetical protein